MKNIKNFWIFVPVFIIFLTQIAPFGYSFKIDKSNQTKVSRRLSEYEKFIKLIHIKNGQLYWINLKLGDSRNRVEMIIGQSLLLKESNYYDFFFAKVKYRGFEIKLDFGSKNHDAPLLSISLGVGDDMIFISQSDVKRLEKTLQKQLPQIRKYLPPEYEESCAWKLPEFESIIIVIKEDGVTIGYEKIFD